MRAFLHVFSFIQALNSLVLAPSMLQGATHALRVLCKEEHNDFLVCISGIGDELESLLTEGHLWGYAPAGAKDLGFGTVK